MTHHHHWKSYKPLLWLHTGLGGFSTLQKEQINNTQQTINYSNSSPAKCSWPAFFHQKQELYCTPPGCFPGNENSIQASRYSDNGTHQTSNTARSVQYTGGGRVSMKQLESNSKVCLCVCLSFRNLITYAHVLSRESSSAPFNPP